MQRDESTAITALLTALGGVSRPGRELAVRLDLLRSIGLRQAWRRRRDDARLGGLRSDGQRPGYRRLWSDAAGELGAETTDRSGGYGHPDRAG